MKTKVALERAVEEKEKAKLMTVSLITVIVILMISAIIAVV